MQPFRRRLQLQASEDGSFPRWREDEQQQQHLTEASSSSPSRSQSLRRNSHSSLSHQQTWISKLTCVVPRCGLDEQLQQQLGSLEFPQHAHSLQAPDDNTDNNKHLFLFPVVLPSPSNVVEPTEKTEAYGEDPSEATLSTQSSDKIGEQQQLQQSGGDVLQQLAIATKKDGPGIGDTTANTEVVPKESYSSSSYYLTSSSSDTSGLPWLTGDSTSYTYDDEENEQVAVVELPEEEEELCIIQSSSNESKLSSASLQDETLLGIHPRHQQQQMRAPSRGPDEDDFSAIPGPPSRPPFQLRQRSASTASACTSPQVAVVAAPAAAATAIAVERKPISSRSLPDPRTSKSRQELDWLVEYAFSNNDNERYIDYSERLEHLETLIRNRGCDDNSDRDNHNDSDIIKKNDASYQVALETIKKQDHHGNDGDCNDDKSDHAEYVKTTSHSLLYAQDQDEQPQMSFVENRALLQAAESVLNASASVLNATSAAADTRRSMNDDSLSGSGHLSYDDFRKTLASARELLASVGFEGDVETSVVQVASERHDDNDDDDQCQELYAKSMSFADTSILAVKSGANNEDESAQNESFREQAKDCSSIEKRQGSKSEKFKALISRFERLSTTGYYPSDETCSTSLLPPTIIETPSRKCKKSKRGSVSLKRELPVSLEKSFAPKPPTNALDHTLSIEPSTKPKDFSNSLPSGVIENSPAAAPKGFFWRSYPVHLTASQEEAELVDTSTSTNADEPRSSCEEASSSATREGHETMNGVDHHSVDFGESRPPVPGLQRYDVRHFI